MSGALKPDIQVVGQKTRDARRKESLAINDDCIYDSETKYEQPECVRAFIKDQYHQEDSETIKVI